VKPDHLELETAPSPECPDDQNRTTCVSDVILLTRSSRKQIYGAREGGRGLSACLERSTDLGGQGAGNDHQEHQR
jgi:hypothetical protein